MLKIQAIGNIGKVRFTSTEKTKVLAFSLATNRPIGKGKTKTTWVECRVWDNLAESLKDYAKKGRAVYVEGRPEASAYVNKKEEAVGDVLIHVDVLELLGPNNSPKPEGEEKSED